MRRGLSPSRERAAEEIRSGNVLVSGSVATKSSRLVDEGEPIELAAEPAPFVSRGGVKLAAALDAFSIDPAGKRCLDLGASTGGFTDCLLRRGASSVVAVDVGRGQLDWSLRNDPRVTSMERTDVRALDPDELGTFEVVVADLSFISLRTVIPSIASLARSADVVVLVKPQFEVGRARVGKGGVVGDRALHAEAVATVAGAAEAARLVKMGEMESPITGADGNREFFLHLRGAGGFGGESEASRRSMQQETDIPTAADPPSGRGLKRVGVLPHGTKPDARALAPKVVQWLQERGHTPCLIELDARELHLPELATDAADFATLDLLVVLGGDGTVLHGVELAGFDGVPILGINLGLLGFLTEVGADEVYEALERALSGDCTIDERSTVHAEILREHGVNEELGKAINEVSVERAVGGKMIRMRLTIGGQAFTSFGADGLIVATPTGSTAYAFSMRGPVVSPSLRSLVVVAVGAHSLFDRPLVVASDEDVRVEVRFGGLGMVVMDGNVRTQIGEGDVLRACVGPSTVRLVRLRPASYFSRLAQKFGVPPA